MADNEEYKIIKLISDPNCKSILTKELFKFSQEEKEKMKNIIKDIKNDNFRNTKDKGNALEKLIGMLFKSNNFFKVYHSVKTSSNEIDLIVEFLENALLFNINKIFGISSNKLIIECKNYNKKVDVTWVGKFIHLLNSHNLETGIIFSKKTLTGTKNNKLTWNDAAGLVKKFYLKSSKIVICLTFDDFEDVLDEKINFIELCKDKISNIQLDTDIFTIEHENSIKKFEEFIVL